MGYTGENCVVCKKGGFEQAQCSYADRLNSAEQAESVGLLKAMEWAEDLKLQHVCFEMDAQTVVNAVLHDHYKAAWENHSIIFEIREKLCNNPLWICKFIHRKCNKPADSLARHARIFKISKSWISFPPSFINLVILQETNIVVRSS